MNSKIRHFCHKHDFQNHLCIDISIWQNGLNQYGPQEEYDKKVGGHDAKCGRPAAYSHWQRNLQGCFSVPKPIRSLSYTLLLEELYDETPWTNIVRCRFKNKTEGSSSAILGQCITKRGERYTTTTHQHSQTRGRN